jgi:NAD(P)-dependent dehydrogenase (short-subunit alcohol dehydrogenase family)
VAGELGAVLVTGASTGIGRATAMRLHREGYSVFAGVRRREDADSLRSEASERLHTPLLDVTDAEAISRTAAEIREATGGKLAGLVNNAGIAVAGPVEATPIEDFRRQIEINLIGQFAVTQSLLPMIRAAKGRVVFMSSIGGRMANPYLSPYNAGKFGLEALGDSLRQEMRRFGVEVSIIEPGAVSTPIWTKGADTANATRAKYSKAAEDLYGTQLDRLEEIARELDTDGVPPERIAEVVLEALTAKRPKTRYLVGGTRVHVEAFIAKYLPDRVRDGIVARIIGI